MKDENGNVLKAYAKANYANFILRGGASALSLVNPQNVEAFYVDIGFKTDMLGRPSPNGIGRSMLEKYILDHELVILIGNSGSGKTFFIKHLFSNIFTNAEIETLKKRWPVYINVKDFVEADNPDFFNYFCRVIYDIIGDDNNKEKWLKSALMKGAFYLFLEDIDLLIAKKGISTDYVKSIEKFGNMFLSFGNRVIITSRIIGYSEIRLNISQNQSECFLSDFSSDDVIKFSNKWNQLLQNQKIKHNDFLNFICSSLYFQEISSNPNYLTKLAVLSLAENENSQLEIIEEIIDDIITGRINPRGEICEIDGIDDQSIIIRAFGDFSYNEIITRKIGFSPRDLVLKLKKSLQINKNKQTDINSSVIMLYPICAFLSQLDNDKITNIFNIFRYYFAGFELSNSNDGISEITLSNLKKIINSGDLNYLNLTLACALYVYNNTNSELLDCSDFLHNFKFDGIVKELIEGVLISNKLITIDDDEVERNTYALNELLTNKSNSVQLRNWAGGVLAEIGDPRKDVVTINKMSFCRVPAGEYFFETNALKKSIIGYDYYLGKFPVTWAQFNAFINSGAHDDFSFYPSTCRNWFFDRESQSLPFLSNSLLRENQPVVAITWYEAVAYCKWLNVIAHNKNWLSDEFEIRLPYESEWVKAARGGIEIPNSLMSISLDEFSNSADIEMIKNKYPRRKYVWQDDNIIPELPCGLFNMTEPTTVGIFSSIKSPYGCEDMCGNVWEWTCSCWGDCWETPVDVSFRNTVRLDDIMSDIMMVKGGSFLVSGGKYFQETKKHLELDYLTKNYVDVRHISHGFRLCIAPYINIDK